VHSAPGDRWTVRAASCSCGWGALAGDCRPTNGVHSLMQASKLRGSRVPLTLEVALGGAHSLMQASHAEGVATQLLRMILPVSASASSSRSRISSTGTYRPRLAFVVRCRLTLGSARCAQCGGPPCLHVDADGPVTLGPCRRIRRAEVWCGAA
jgi:hypothetical protein